MCPQKNWFLSYKSYEGENVLLGNNKACKIVGIGSIKLKLADGTEKVLTDVRHIPELKWNLVSVGMLDSHGFCCKVEGGVLKVLKGSLVIIKGRLDNGLYILQAKVIIADASTRTSTDIQQSRAQIWQKRLAHISYEGLKELRKQGLLGKDQMTGVQFCEHCILAKQND